MPGKHDKVMPETSGEEGTTSGSEVSIGEEGDDNRFIAESDESDDDESECSDDEESSASDSSNSDEDSSSEDSGSSDSLWGVFDGADNKETQEANEASALHEFQTALDYLVEGNGSTAAKILNKLLSNPLVKVFQTNYFDWEADVDERLSKMARLYVGIRKNLAKLDKDNTAEHYLQILSIAPKNPVIWLNLGINSLNNGDVDFAKFAFEHAEGNDSLEALLSALYLSRNYHACLRLAQKCLDLGVCEHKSLFLKEQIRSVNNHYREFCDDVFSEHRRYDKVKVLDGGIKKKMVQKLTAVEERINSIKNEDVPTLASSIEISLDANQTVEDIATIFCDLFDRIEAYSSLSSQEITFSRWDDRRNLKDVTTVLENILDIVDVVDFLATQVSIHIGKSHCRSLYSKASFFSGTADCFLRRSMRNAMELSFEEESYNLQSTCQLDGTLPSVELAESFGIKVCYITPLKEEITRRSSRTPTPDSNSKCFDTDQLLFLLRTTLNGGSWNMFGLLDTFLCLVADFSPTFGAIPSCLSDILVQCYRRFNLLSSDLCQEKYIRLHVLMDELGEAHARDYCIRWHCGGMWNDKELMQRFVWNHAKTITDKFTKLSLLKRLYSYMEDDELVFTAKGWFVRDDVRAFIDELERSNRIVSVSRLRKSCRFEEVIAIITGDVDFNSLEGDDLFIMVDYLLDAYCKVKKYDSAMEFASRVFHLCFSYKQLPSVHINSLLHSIYGTDWDEVTIENSEKVGYFLCRLISVENFASDWNIWKELFKVVRRINGPISIPYIESLDPVKNDDCLPSVSLDVLVKAHERLGELRTCGCDKGAFLLYFMNQLYECVSNEKVMAVLQKEERAWIWSNVSEEISQCLFCLFGRYSKRRRALEDHDCNVSIPDLDKYSSMIVELAMPHPLPQYDDKERLGHDVVDLLLNRFPSVIKYSEERGRVLNSFIVWMRDASKVNASNRLQWPTVEDEPYVQACVWYLMALHHYRQSNHDEIEKYSKLFLTSGHATLKSRVTAGIWAVLAYTSVYRIFQMDDDLLFLEWTWHVLPFRISISIDSHIGVVFFQLASTLYQIGTRLSRFFLTLPSDDWRLCHAQTLLKELRMESLHFFEKALAQVRGDAGTCEYQWLGYFFIAKLHGKLHGNDVVKVVDGLYEAACSCELAEYFYPVKINVKKQQNIEPVELHYQVHSMVWKYLCRNSSPPLEILVSLLAYLRAMQSHKVVRSNLSLFSIHPELHETMINITLRCKPKFIADDIAHVMESIVTRVDLMGELWSLCHRGFELVCDRFPHMKSYYRLAEMELSRGNVEAAYNYLTRHIFRRKKREDSLFDSVVEITSQDIDRSGSFPYHVERALQLTTVLAYRMKDVSTLMSIITTLVSNVEVRNETYILKERQGALLMHATNRLYILLMESASPKALRLELYRAWQIVKRCKSLIVRTVEARFTTLIERIFGSVADFVAEQSVFEDTRRKQVRKRKLTSYDLGASQSCPVLLVPGGVSSALDQTSQSGDPLKLMRLALQI